MWTGSGMKGGVGMILLLWLSTQTPSSLLLAPPERFQFQFQWWFLGCAASCHDHGGIETHYLRHGMMMSRSHAVLLVPVPLPVPLPVLHAHARMDDAAMFIMVIFTFILDFTTEWAGTGPAPNPVVFSSENFATSTGDWACCGPAPIHTGGHVHSSSSAPPVKGTSTKRTA
jgi:hypothetical protein